MNRRRIPNQEQRAIIERAMQDKNELQVIISIGEAWVLVAGLQVAARHPEIPPSTRSHLLNLGRQFQAAIVERHPEAYDVLEQGWHNPYSNRRQ